MVNQPQGDGKAQVAQFIYLAQLEACKSDCKCKTCELMRKATTVMSDAVLAGEDLLKGPAAESVAVESDPIHPASL